MREVWRLLNIGPQRGLPADFHSLLASTEACFKMFNSSFHQNLLQ